jgi:hypothetical protein
MTQKRKRLAGGRAVLKQRHCKTHAHISAACAVDARLAAADRRPVASALSGNRAADGAILFRDSAERPHALADARWFAAHTDRSHRFRHAARDEAPAEFVIVRQIKPGVRLRLAVALDDATQAPALLSADDDVLHVCCDLLIAQRCAAPGEVLREVARRRGCGGRA